MSLLPECLLHLIYAGLVVGIAVIILFLAYAMFTGSKPNLSCHESEKFFLDPSTNERRPFPSLDDSATLYLTVVVPAYNEETRLSAMMDEAMSYLTSRQSKDPSFTFEVIIVDDGSRDGTTKEALRYSGRYGVDKVRVCTLEKNRAKGGAVRMGMLRGRGRRLLFADADGATKFSDVSKLEKELESLTSDDSMGVVCGSRAHLEQQSIAQRSLFRTLLMHVFHLCVLLCVRDVRDTQCGFKMFTRPAARLLFYNLHVEKWAFNVELLHIAQHFKIPIYEVSVNWVEIEGSKLSPLLASIQMFRDLLLIKLRYVMGSWVMQAKPRLPTSTNPTHTS